MAGDIIHLEDPNLAAAEAFDTFQKLIVTHPRDVHSVLEEASGDSAPEELSGTKAKVAAALMTLLDETDNGFYIDYERPFLDDVLTDPVYKELVANLKKIEDKGLRPPQIRRMALRGLTLYVEQQLSQKSQAS